MTKIQWSELFTKTTVHIKLIEQNIACNSSAKPGATDLSMCDLIERTQTDVDGL